MQIKDEKVIEKIIAKHDRLEEILSDIRLILARQEEQLKEHMRRTLAAEKRLDHLTDRVLPIEQHIIFIQRFLKTFGVIFTVISGSLGIIVGVLKIMELLNF